MPGKRHSMTRPERWRSSSAILASPQPSRRRRTMKRFGLIALAFVALSACSGMNSDSKSDSGWVTLLDGTNLDNWNMVGDANWRIEDGAAVADAGNGFLVSKQTYTDFQIRAEFWVSDDANSGIFIRGSDPHKIAGANSYEVNIFDK